MVETASFGHFRATYDADTYECRASVTAASRLQPIERSALIYFVGKEWLYARDNKRFVGFCRFCWFWTCFDGTSRCRSGDPEKRPPTIFFYTSVFFRVESVWKKHGNMIRLFWSHWSVEMWGEGPLRSLIQRPFGEARWDHPKSEGASCRWGSFALLGSISNLPEV
jgi:hypothetical protein